jgi:hypothetical protein
MAQETLGAGDASILRVEFTPTSNDGRFGDFQLHVRGVPLGDGTTTGLYPHYCDLEDLSVSVRRLATQRRKRLDLGDTFDHLRLYLQLTKPDIVLSFTTRPAAEWGCPPPWAPEPGHWMRLSVARSDFLVVWQAARPQFVVSGGATDPTDPSSPAIEC